MSDENHTVNPSRRQFIQTAGALIGASVAGRTAGSADALSAVVHLSERSVARKSAPMDFPDFTRGHWKTNAPLGIVRA